MKRGKIRNQLHCIPYLCEKMLMNFGLADFLVFEKSTVFVCFFSVYMKLCLVFKYRFKF